MHILNEISSKDEPGAPGLEPRAGRSVSSLGILISKPGHGQRNCCLLRRDPNYYSCPFDRLASGCGRQVVQRQSAGSQR